MVNIIPKNGIPLDMQRMYCVCVCVCVCVSAVVWTWGRVMIQNLRLVDNTGKITKGLYFIGTKQEQSFAVRLTFLITKLNDSNPWHSKLWLLLKYLFVKSKKNRLPLCALMLDSRPSFGFRHFRLDFIHFGLKLIQFYMYMYVQIRHQYNFHQVTMMNNTISQDYFWKLLQKHFGSRSW